MEKIVALFAVAGAANADSIALTMKSEEKGSLKGVVPSPDNSIIYTCCFRDSVQAFSTQTHEQLFQLDHKSGLNSIVLSSDGGTLYAGCNDGVGRAWDTKSRKQLLEMKCSKCKQVFGEAGQLSPDGGILYSYKSGVNAWNTSTGKHLFTMQDSGIVGSGDDCSFGGSLAVSLDGGKVWGSGRDEGVGEWCAVSSTKEDSTKKTSECTPGEILQRDEVGNEGTGDVILSPDGKVFYSARDEGGIWVTDTKSHEEHAPMEVDYDWVPCLALSFDGTILYASEYTRIFAFDTRTNEIVFDLHSSHFDRMRSMTLSPDGGTLYVTCWDGFVRAWDTKKHKQLFRLNAGGATATTTTTTTTTSLHPSTCTPENQDPYATGVKVGCCHGLDMKLKNWNSDGRWFYKCTKEWMMLV